LQVERLDRSTSRWVQHPCDQTLLICIDGETQHVHKWSTLERVTEPMPKKLLESQIQANEVLPGKIGNITLEDNTSTASHTSSKTLEQIFPIKGRYIILEYLSTRHHEAKGATPPPSSHLDLIDIKSSLTSSELRRRSLPRLSENVNQIIGIFQGQVVFLDYQYWVCTWEIEGGEDSYRRHFFFPKDWLSLGALKLVVLNQFGTLLCPKNGEVAIVRSGINI
jgi:hypothetical protein